MVIIAAFWRVVNGYTLTADFWGKDYRKAACDTGYDHKDKKRCGSLLYAWGLNKATHQISLWRTSAKPELLLIMLYFNL